MSKMFSRNEIFAIQDETTFAKVPNTDGTATVAAGDAFRAIKCNLKPITEDLKRRDKTGGRTASTGIAGKRNASWDMETSLVTSGVAGTPPDYAPIFTSAFGQAAASKTGTKTVTGGSVDPTSKLITLTSAGHGLSDYDVVTISGIVGLTNANGVFPVKAPTENTILLLGSDGESQTWSSGGTIDKAALVWSPVDDTLPSFSLFSFRKPKTGAQRVAAGCVVKTMQLNLGDGISEMQASGPCYWVLNNLHFGNYDLYQRCGLTAMLDELLNPVTSGGPIAAFRGRAIMKDEEIMRLRTGTIKFDTGVDLPMDTFNKGYADEPEADDRNVAVSFTCYEEDAGIAAELEEYAHTKQTIDMVFQIGLTPGSIYVAVCRGVQLASPDRDDSSRSFSLSYGDSRAYGSSSTALDEFKLWAI